MSNIKRTRSTPSGYTKTRYFCYDCGKNTAAVLQVYRDNGATFVCRANTGCHKAKTSQQLYSGKCHDLVSIRS